MMNKAEIQMGKNGRSSEEKQDKMLNKDTWELHAKLLERLQETIELREGKSIKQLVKEANQRVRLHKHH